MKQAEDDKIDETRSFSGRLLRPLIWSIFLTMVLYAFFIFANDAQAVADSAALLGVSGWLVILALSLLNFALRFVRWHFCLSLQGYQLPKSENLLYYIAGFSFITTPAKAGEVIRSWYLKHRHQVSYTHSFAALFTDRMMDVAAVVLLALTASLTFPEYGWLMGIIGGIFLAVLPLIHLPLFHRFIRWICAILGWKKLQLFGTHLVDLLQSASLLLGGVNLILGLLISTLAWTAQGIGFWWVCSVLGIDIDPLTAMGIYSIGMLAGAASLIPGGLGSTEAVLGLLLVSLGAAISTAVAATLIIRMATLWFALLLGILSIGWLETHKSS